MPRRRTKYQPDRQIEILRQVTVGGEEQWSSIGKVYAQRRDMRGDAKEADGEYSYTKAVTYLTPKTMQYTRPPAPAGGSDAFGARELGEQPMGGRGAQPERLRETGSQVRPGDAVRDLGAYGHPIFTVKDVFEMNRKLIEIVTERTDQEGAIYGGA